MRSLSSFAWTWSIDLVPHNVRMHQELVMVGPLKKGTDIMVERFLPGIDGLTARSQSPFPARICSLSCNVSGFSSLCLSLDLLCS